MEPSGLEKPSTELKRQTAASVGARLTETESARIAMELHDGVIQRLAVVGYDLERLISQLARGKVEEGIELARAIQTELSQEMNALRGLMVELRSPALEGQDLASALREQAARFEGWDGVKATLEIELDRALVPSAETALYRVVQESLLNVAKHARAATVSVRLVSNDEGALLQVRDDGVGFEPEGTLDQSGVHLGLASMRRRVDEAGGSFSITSAPGEGTTVAARFGPQVVLPA